MAVAQGFILCHVVNVGLHVDFIFSKDWKNKRFVVILHHERELNVTSYRITWLPLQVLNVHKQVCGMLFRQETMDNERRTIPKLSPTKGQKLTHHGIED